MDPSVNLAIARALGHDAPFGQEELGLLGGPLRIEGARALDGLEACGRLRELELHACILPSFGAAAGLDELETLRVTCSPMSTLDFLQPLERLRELELAFAGVIDARILTDLPSLMRLVVVGNPLDDASFAELKAFKRDPPVREGRRVFVDVSRDYDLDLTRQLRAAGIPAAFDVYDGRSWLVLMDVGAWEDGVPDAQRVPSSAVVNALTIWDLEERSLDWLRTELFGPDRVRTPFPAERQREVALGPDAAGWVREAALDADLEAALLDFTERFPDITYARWSRARIDEWEGIMGIQFPPWYRRLLGALAGFAVNAPAAIQFDAFDRHSPNAGRLGDIWYQPGMTTPFPPHSAVIEHNGLVSIAQWLETGRSNLAFHAAEEDDMAIYEYSIEDTHDDRGLTAEPYRVFDSIASMFRHISQVHVGG